MKANCLAVLAIVALPGMLPINALAGISVTAYDTGVIAGTWNGKTWNYVTGIALWQNQNASAVQVGCTAVLGCSLAVGTVNSGRFYPRYGFVNIQQGTTWEETFDTWRYYHGIDISFKYPEPVDRITAAGACSLIGLYWGKDEDGGYREWLPVPESQCAPFYGP